MKFRTAYDGLADKVSEETGLECKDPSLAVQEQRDDADINNIVRRFGLTGELPVASRVALPEGVFYDNCDYRECLDVVNAAQKSFASMPASVRNRFGNDAAAFVEFAENPDNLDECIKLGLAPPKVVERASEPVAPAG